MSHFKSSFARNVHRANEESVEDGEQEKRDESEEGNREPVINSTIYFITAKS